MFYALPIGMSFNTSKKKKNSIIIPDCLHSALKGGISHPQKKTKKTPRHGPEDG